MKSFNFDTDCKVLKLVGDYMELGTYNLLETLKYIQEETDRRILGMQAKDGKKSGKPIEGNILYYAKGECREKFLKLMSSSLYQERMLYEKGIELLENIELMNEENLRYKTSEGLITTFGDVI